MSLLSVPTKEQVKKVPKALLHDHLDGGLRPETIIGLAEKIGYKKCAEIAVTAIEKEYFKFEKL